MTQMLDKQSIKRFYDRLGTRLDSQAFYEQSGLDVLIRYGHFESAHAVFEYGCGTGRLAKQLLQEYLPSDCHYTAIDISDNMIATTCKRLERWKERTCIEVSTGSVVLDYDDDSFDRFVCTYVVDLLSDDDAFKLIEEARRVLRPDGLLCLVSIRPGDTWFSKMVMRVWHLIYKLNPILTGGCRPISLLVFIPEKKWDIINYQLISRYGVAIEIVIACCR